MNAILLAAITFVSCTECPKDTRGFLNIPIDAKCDIVKWKLQVFSDGNYTLDAEWSYNVDNRTTKKSGELIGSKGTWKVGRNNPGFSRSEIYVFAPNDRPTEWLPLLKLNDNMFQLMTKDKKMLPGGEGYANMLTRTDPVVDRSIDFALANPDITPKSMTVSGRTPLKPLDKEMKITDNEDHAKIKWLIKFYADGRLEVREILEHVKDLKGKWTVEKGWKDNKDAIVYKLEFEGYTLSLLKGSDDIYFFLTNDGLVPGDQEFGTALIRRSS